MELVRRGEIYGESEYTVHLRFQLNQRAGQDMLHHQSPNVVVVVACLFARQAYYRLSLANLATNSKWVNLLLSSSRVLVNKSCDRASAE